MRTVVFRFTAFICCALFCAHYFSAYAQDSAPVIVTGKVVDEQGAPMAGVTIIEEGGGEFQKRLWVHPLIDIPYGQSCLLCLYESGAGMRSLQPEFLRTQKLSKLFHI